MLAYRALLETQLKLPVKDSLLVKAEKSLIEMVPFFPELAPRFLRQYLKRVGKHDAYALAEEFYTKNSSSPEHLVHLANFWYGEKIVRRGDELLSEAKEIDSNLPLIFEEEASNHKWRNNMSREMDALNHLRRLYPEDSSEYHQVSLRLAFLKYRNYEYSDANNLYARHLSQHPKFEDLIAAYWCAYTVKDVEKKDQYRKLLYKQHPESIKNEIDLAKVYLTHRQFLAAEELLNQAKRRGLEHNLDFLHTTIQLYWLTNDWSSAESVISHAIALKSEFSVAQLLDYASIAEANGNVDLALRVLELENSHSAATFHVRYRKAMLLLKKQQYEYAWHEFHKASIHYPLSSRIKTDSTNQSEMTTNDNNLGWRKQLYRYSRRRDIAHQTMLIAKELASKGNFNEACNVAVRMSTAKVSAAPRFSTKYRFKDFEHRNIFEHFSECVETLKIDEYLVVYESFHGGSTSCNPLALCLHALEDETLSRLHHVWIVNEDADIDERLRNRPNVSFVLRGTEGALLALSTAKYVINNTSLPYWYFRRDSQRYLNTWHGIPWKYLGKSVRSEPFAYGNIARNLLSATHIIAPDHHTLDALLDSHNVKELVTKESYCVTGYPRVDLTLNVSAERAHELRTLLGAQDNQKIVLYAPTWRGNVNDVSFDLDLFQQAVEKLTETGAFVAVRAHHFMEASIDPSTFKNAHVVPRTINSNELLNIVDVLVTDYSSILFDFLPMGRPLYKFIPDYKEYSATRGMYFQPEDIPGANIYSLEDLSASVSVGLNRVDESSLHDPYRHFFAEEDGKSSQRVWEFFLKEGSAQKHERSSNALFLTNSMNPNGITRSLANASMFLSETPVKSYVALPTESLKFADISLREEISKYSKILPLIGGHAGSSLQNWLRRHMLHGDIDLNHRCRKLISTSERLEARRRFGETKFTTLVDFDGYSPQLTMFCSMQKGVLSDNIYHWLHSAMVEEQRIKYPWLRAAFTWYNDFDGLVSVSEGVMGQNQKSLLENFGISSSNHLTIENLLGPKRILELSKEPISDLGEEWLKKDHKSILVVGRFAPEKNHASLLNAFANIKESLPELKLGFMGKGPQEAYIRQLVKELNLESVVSFLGHESNPYPLIKAADIVFQPSIHEGQGIVLLEALALGTKVFASDIPPFRSVLGDGIYGDLFSPTVKGIEGALLSIQASKLSDTRNFDAEDYELRAQSKLLALLNGEL